MISQKEAASLQAPFLIELISLSSYFFPPDLLPEPFILFNCNNANITNLVSPNSFVHSLSTMVLSAIKI